MATRPPEHARYCWLRRRLYLARVALVAAAAACGATWLWLPVPSEARIAARFGFWTAVGMLATTLPVRDEVRYREWRDRRRLGARS